MSRAFGPFSAYAQRTLRRPATPRRNKRKYVTQVRSKILPHCCSRQTQEETWRVDEKKFANKRSNFDRVQAKAMLDTAARSQMRKRDPGVLCVPHDRRHRAKSEYAKQ